MRVRTGNARKEAHRKVIKANKGYRMTKSSLFKVAHEAKMHAGQYSYAHRRRKPSQVRNLWIKRIYAALMNEGKQYSRFMNDLKKAEVGLNRKVLSEIAFNYPEVFSQIVKSF